MAHILPSGLCANFEQPAGILQLDGKFPLDRVSADIAVIGGGPAGAIAAWRLCQMGFRTCLIERRGLARSVVGEALPASTLRLLHEVGLTSAVARSGALRCDEILQRWGGSGENARPTSVYMVDRGRLDAALLEAAADIGVEILSPARLRRQQETLEGWNLEVETADGIGRVAARFLIDARGRRAAGTRRLGAPTAALCGRWRGVALPAQPQLRIEAAEDAWIWGAPLADGSFVAQVYLRTSDCAGLSEAAREVRYRAVLRESKLFAGCRRADLIDPVRIRDASCRVATEPATRNTIRIGDSCVAMDPLSSQGVQSAIRSALQGSVVANTILSGGDIDAGIEFYRNATRAVAERHRDTSAALYADQRDNASSFWLERASSRRAPDDIEVDRIPLSSFLRLSPGARVIDHPAIEGDVIRRRPALIHPRLSEPTAFVEGIAVSRAIALVGSGNRAATILAQWAPLMPGATARVLLGWLIRHEVLVSDESLFMSSETSATLLPSAIPASGRFD
jgi:flavin-dependent dehydrogenase